MNIMKVLEAKFKLSTNSHKSTKLVFFSHPFTGCLSCQLCFLYAISKPIIDSIIFRCHGCYEGMRKKDCIVIGGGLPVQADCAGTTAQVQLNASGGLNSIAEE